MLTATAALTGNLITPHAPLRTQAQNHPPPHDIGDRAMTTPFPDLRDPSVLITGGGSGPGTARTGAHLWHCLPDTPSPDDIAGGWRCLAPDIRRATPRPTLGVDGCVVVTG